MMNSPLARAQNTILAWQKKCDAKDREIERLQKRNALLEDVARAAEGVSWPGPTLERALDKLKEITSATD